MPLGACSRLCGWDSAWGGVFLENATPFAFSAYIKC